MTWDTPILSWSCSSRSKGFPSIRSTLRWDNRSRFESSGGIILDKQKKTISLIRKCVGCYLNRLLLMRSSRSRLTRPSSLGSERRLLSRKASWWEMINKTLVRTSKTSLSITIDLRTEDSASFECPPVSTRTHCRTSTRLSDWLEQQQQEIDENVAHELLLIFTKREEFWVE